MLDWVKRRLRRRIIHETETCYKCGLDTAVQWTREQVGRFTFEEGYLCEECRPREEKEEIVFAIPEVDYPEPISIEERKERWIAFVKEIEEEGSDDA